MISIRNYVAEDSKFVLEWLDSKEVFNNWSRGYITKYPLSDEEFNKFVFDKIDTSNAFCYIFLDEVKPIGFLIMEREISSYDDVRCSFILLDNKLRGKGYGKEMLKIALNHAFSYLDAERVCIGTLEDNLAAKGLYKSVGMSFYRKVENAVIIDGVSKALDYYEMTDGEMNKEGLFSYDV